MRLRTLPHAAQSLAAALFAVLSTVSAHAQSAAPKTSTATENATKSPGKEDDPGQQAMEEVQLPAQDITAMAQQEEASRMASVSAKKAATQTECIAGCN